MEVATLKSMIQRKQVNNYLLFTGEEWKVMDIYIGQIGKVLNKEVRRIDSIQDIYGRLKSKSFVDKSYVYVVRDDKELMQNEKLQQQIDNGILRDNILIHLITNIDKRTKFYKRYTDTIIVFNRLSEATLYKYIAKEINLSQRNIKRLAEICEYDYGRTLLEIDKIKRFDHVIAMGEDDTFEHLLSEGLIYIAPYDAIFDLVDSILDRKVNKTFDLLEQSYAVGEATMVMLSVLYNNAKAVLQVQSYDGNNLSQATGLTGWQIKNARSHVGKYSDEELIYILKLVNRIERGIKTGLMEENFAMQYLLTHVL